MIADSVAVETAHAPKNWVYLSSIILAVMVGGISSICIKQLLLPIQSSQLAPHQTALAFSLVASGGAVAGLVVSPLVGACSDRTRWRLGRRRPWITGGLAVAMVGFILMAFAGSIPLLLLGEVLAQCGVDTILALSTAIIPDQIPQEQRPLLSAGVGMAPNIGGVIGLLLVSHLTNPRLIFQGYLLIAAVSLCCVLVFLLILRDPPVSPEHLPSRFQWGDFFSGFARPLRSRDFGLVVASRTLVYLTFTILGAYLLFYLQGGLHVPLPLAAQHLTTFQLLSTIVLLVCALAAGWISGRTGRIKGFAMSGAGLMALGVIVIALIPAWTALLLAAAVFGAGFGLYLGVDVALAVQVLPSQAGRGKDLGLMYNSIYLSLIVSPVVGGAILRVSPGGYVWLFTLAACAALAAGLLVLPLKAIR